MFRNEVTMGNDPPFCFTVFADYEIIPGMENTSMIKNIRTEKCLKGNGYVF